MKVKKVWTLLIALIVGFLISETVSTAESIRTRDYWVLRDPYSAKFTGGTYLTVTYQASEGLYYVDFMGTGTQLQNYDPSGNLLYYGTKRADGGYFTVSPGNNVILFSAVIEVGKTYPPVSWWRDKYDKFGNYLGKDGRDSVVVTVTGPHDIKVPAGPYEKTYRFNVVDTWFNDLGQSQIFTSVYYLAENIGWVRVIRDGVTYELISPPVTTTTTSTTTSTSTTTTIPVLKPLAITDWATSVTTGSATLNGRVNPNGKIATYYFEYGLTTAYGSNTPDGSAGIGTYEVSVNGDLSGLVQDTTYHYRIVATNSGGIAYGDDKSFRTTILYIEPFGSCGGNSPCYSTIQDAIDGASSGGTIRIARESYDENITFGLSGNLILEGGWDVSFTTRSARAGSSNTVITGKMTISGEADGIVFVDDLVLKIYSSTYTNGLGQTFRLIPAGTFTMGSPLNEPGRDSDETQHQVTLTKSFYMQTTEVTQSQWEAVMGSNPSWFTGCSTCPVEQVSWNDAQSYITQMNTRGEGTYSLPTEAQWAYAARAGSTTAFYNGGITETGCGYDPNLDAIGWYCYNSDDETRPVAQKTPNAWGLYDISGNVYEWCQDWNGSYPSGAVTNPTGPSSGSNRVLRGGGWNADAWRCRSANRAYSPDGRGINIGFRLLRQPMPDGAVHERSSE